MQRMPSADGPRPEQAEALRGSKVESPAAGLVLWQLCSLRGGHALDAPGAHSPLRMKPLLATRFGSSGPCRLSLLACPEPKMAAAWSAGVLLQARGCCCRVLQGAAAGFRHSAQRPTTSRRNQVLGWLGAATNRCLPRFACEGSVHHSMLLWRDAGCMFRDEERHWAEPTTWMPTTAEGQKCPASPGPPRPQVSSTEQSVCR